jgi:hypothetical protein
VGSPWGGPLKGVTLQGVPQLHHNPLSRECPHTIFYFLFSPLSNMGTYKKMGVSHCGLAIYIKKYLKAKEELWKLKYFTMKKYNRQNNPLKKTKIFQDITIL